jgi:hypothetical protein
MNNDAPTFTDPSTISKLAMGGIALIVLVELLMLVFVVGEWLDPTRQFEVADGDALSFWILLFGLSALLRIPVFIFSMVCFLIWIYRAAGNASALDVMVPEFSPGWAVGAWFIPIANLFIPYKVVKGLWIESEPVEEESTEFGSPADATTTLGLWWAGWLVYNISARIADKLFESADRATGEFLVVSSISSLAGIASGILVIRILKMISSRQKARYASLIKGAAVYDAPPAPPTFG